MFSVIHTALVQLVCNTRVLNSPRLPEKGLHSKRVQTTNASEPPGHSPWQRPLRLRLLSARSRAGGFQQAEVPGRPPAGAARLGLRAPG